MTLFRNYTSTTEAVKTHYYKMRSKQTLEHVNQLNNKYLDFKRKIDFWDIIKQLEDFVDVSDPDITLPNAQHLYQTAEKIREDNLPDWLQLVGLIHDMGKIIFKWGNDLDGTTIKEQWSIVGDTFIVGCQLPNECVYPEFNMNNPDMKHPIYNSKYGIYKPNCGLDNTKVAFGHDEYLYQLLLHNKTTLPIEALYIIRYHSLYPWHSGNAYHHLTNERDLKMLEWVKKFNKYDLYTKSNKIFNVDDLKMYYNKLVLKYLNNTTLLDC